MNQILLASIMIIPLLIITVPQSFAVSFTDDTQCFQTFGCDITGINNPDSLEDLLIANGFLPLGGTGGPVLDGLCFDAAGPGWDDTDPDCDASLFESTAQVLTVVPPPGDFLPEVFTTWTILRDTGNFLYSFGFCDANDVVLIDPITEREQWATECLKEGTQIFDDTSDDEGDTEGPVIITVGDNLIFWIIPNNDLATFNLDPSAFYPTQKTNHALRAPLFSVENANPGGCPSPPPAGADTGCDQMLVFVGDEFTMFTFEDLSRDVNGPGSNSDEDYTDLAFFVDLEFIEIPTDEFCDIFPDEPECIVGGELLPLDTTALLVAGATTPFAAYMYVLAALGLGAFWFARNPYNVRNAKAIMSGYLDRFSKTD